MPLAGAQNGQFYGAIWTAFIGIFVQITKMKKAVIVVPEGQVNLSSISGSFEILNRANKYWQKLGHPSLMTVQVAGTAKEIVLSNGLFSIHPVPIKQLKKNDLIILPSLSYDYKNVIRENKELIQWIREQYQEGVEIASICTGAFLLAATGLLDGKTCSTHWNAADDFRKMFPRTDLQADKLIVSGHGLYTNGGAYSFLNLLLFLIEKYFDRSTAIYCSKVFQVEMDRDSQSPFFIFQEQKNHGDELVQEAQSFIEENRAEKISFEKLATKLAISRRNFDRRFIKAVGNTPLEYMQRVKVEFAKKALEHGRKTVFEAMIESGYSDDKAFREVFKKFAGISPLDYRARFNKQQALV